MLKTIRGKITLGVVLTSIVVFCMINLITWKIFKDNLQTFIINDMDKLRTIVVSEMKRQYLIENEVNNLNYKNNLWPTLNIISGQYDTYVSVNNNIDDHIQFAGELLDEKDIQKITIDSNGKSSLLYIHNEKALFYTTYAYPMYMEDDYLGTLVFQKNYSNEYNHSIDLMTKIVIIQVFLFIVMILVIYFWLKKTTYSLSYLADGMIFVGQGDFSNRLEVRSKDEVATLIHHFNMMQDRIEEQMDYLQLEKKKIEELEKSSRDFFNYATHEMKTPITAIIGYTQLLQRGDIDEEVKERVYNRIIAESERIHKMVQNMLVVARSKEIQIYKPQNFNIKCLLVKIVHEFQLAFKKQNIEIHLKSEDVMVFAIEEEIRSILLNLIDNGIKYSQDGKIDIECKCKDNNIYITVENKCTHIPQKIRENLFNPFIKYNYGNHKQISSGLGLFICRELAEKNNAHINYTINGDKICFSIELVKKQ